MIIPKTAVLSESANSAQIMNYIRQNASKSYQAAVPIAAENVNSVRAVGDIILGDDNLYNTFASALINRIGRVIIQSKLYRNPLEQFKLGYMELGDTVEEIFVNLLKPHPFEPDTAARKWMEREKPNIDAIFHKINFQAFYKITISYNELRAAFLTWSGLHDLVGRIIEQAYTTANWDEFIMFKYLLASAAAKNMLYPIEIPDPNVPANAKAVTTAMVAASNDLLFISGDFNAMGVPNYTDKDDQLMIINTKFAAIQDVEVLAQAFNMSKAELQGHVVMINGFSMSAIEQQELERLQEIIGTPYPQFSAADLAMLVTIPAMLVDQKFFMVIDQLFEMRNAENGEGLYWQYWLHTWKMFSWSPFANAIAFTTSPGTVTGVTITPTSANAVKGVVTDLKFTGTVSVSGMQTTKGVWSLAATSGSKPVNSTVDNGVVHVAADEQNTSLTLTFTAAADPTKKATAQITIGA